VGEAAPTSTVAVAVVTIIGAGAAGSDIALAAALAGYRTILEDILPASLRRAAGEIKAGLDRSIGAGFVTSGQAESALSLLEYAGNVEDAARQADLVIEAVPEEMESRTEIFTLLDKICRPRTILASTTTTLSISDIAAVTYRPQQCVAMRFAHPVQSMKVLEIVRAVETDDATVSACAEVGRRMGKEVRIVEG
jgi:3-hydroxybutyryl-CoA dehydrogenase